MSDCLINGAAADRIDVGDRGLQYGDGLFETLNCQQGQVRYWSLHRQRLAHGCERLGLPFDAYGELEHEIAQLAAGRERCLIKVIVTRGQSRQRGYRPDGEERCTRILTRHAWPGTALPPHGARLGLSSVRLSANPILAGLKHLNRLEQVLAQRAMQPARYDEVLMLSVGGDVIGGSMSNVFFADEHAVITPAVDQCGVAGVMRALTLQIAERLAIPVQIRPIAAAELSRLGSACISNVRWGLQPVSALDDRPLQPHALLQRLMGELNAARA